MKKAKKPGAKPGGSAAKPKAKPGALKTAQEKRADDRRVETTLQAAAKRRSSRGGEAEAAAAAAKTATAAAAAAPAPEGQAQSPGGEVVQSVGVGSTVSVRGCAGFVRYRGPVFFAEGAWLGVHFGEPHAEWGDACNGTVAGTTYFASEDKCALFVPESSVVEAAAAAAAAAAAKEAGTDKGPQEFIDAATATLRVLSSAEANTTTTAAAAAANSASAKKAPQQQQQQQPQARRSSHGSGRSTSITSLKRGSLGSSARGSGRQLRPRPSQPLEPLGRKPAATATVGASAAAAATALPASQAPAVAGAVSPPLPPGPLPQLQPKQEGSNAAAAAAAAAAEAAAVDAEEQERGAIMAGWEAEAAAPCGGGGSGKNAALLLRGSQQQQHAAAAAAAAVQLNPPCSPLPTLPQAPPQPEAAEPEPAPHTPLHAGGGGVGILAAATAPPEKQQTRSVVAAALLSDEPPQQPSEAAAGASPPPPPPPAARPAARPTAASHLQTAKRLLRDALHAVGKGEACLRGYNDAVEDCSEEAQRLLAVVTSEEGTIAAAVEEAFYGGGGEGGGGGGGGASSNVRSLRRRIVKATGWAAAVKEGEEENDDDEADSSSSSAAALFPPPAWRLLKEAAEEVQGLYGVAGRGEGGGGGREVALVGEAGAAAAAAAAAAPALPPLLVEIGGVNRMVGELEGRWRRLPEMGACVRGHEEVVRRLTHDAEEAAAQRAAAAASGDVERVEELYRTEAATVEALAAALRAMVERLDEVEPRLLHPFQEVASNLAAHHRAETATLGERVAAERRRVAGAGGATRAALAGCEDELHRERAALRREAAGLADETDAGDELVARLYREAAERLEQADAELAAKQRRLERRAAVGRAVAVVDVSLHACRVQKRRAAEAQRAALEELDGCGAELRAQQEAGAAAVLRLEDGVRERASELHRERMRLGEGYYKEFQRLYLTLGEVRHKKQQQYDRYDALHGDEVMRLEQCADTLNPTEEAKEHARLRDHYKAVCASLKQAVEALDTRLAVCDSPFAASVHAALRGAGRLHTHPSETLKKIVDASKQKLLLYYKDQEEISGRQKKEEAEVVAAAAAATAAAASTGAASGGATTAVVAPSPKKIEMPPPDNPPPAQPAAASEVPA